MAGISHLWGVNGGHDSADAIESASLLMQKEHLAAFGILNREKLGIWTAYFALPDFGEIVILTSAASAHGRFLLPGTQIAMCLFLRTQSWGDPIAGLQAYGEVAIADQVDSEQVYSKRFAEFAAWRRDGGQSNAAFYLIRLNALKLVDESRYGEEKFIEIQRIGS